ncbi:MAG: hypothetical protein AAF565_10105, partial [Pseudomonadota bacterium]
VSDQSTGAPEHVLGLFGMLFKGERLRNAAAKVLSERCGVHLGSKGQELLTAECKHVSSLAGNSSDVGARVLAAMVDRPRVYGLDDETRLRMARWAERLGEEATLPDTLAISKKALERAKSGDHGLSGFGRGAGW